jgi:hypothetical protein
LRTVQLQLDAREPPAKTILVASASWSEEPTGLVADFGLALAARGHSVVIVDMNGASGLAARLEAFPTGDGGGVQVLSAGDRAHTTDDVAVVSLLARTRERSDYVLVNALPLTESGEALRVVSVVDVIVMLVRPRHTTVEAFRTAVGLVLRTRGRVDGLLVLSGGGARGSRSTERQASARRAHRPRRGEVYHAFGNVGDQRERSG